MSMQYCIVSCVDDNLVANLQYLQQMLSCKKHTKLCDFYLITCKNNPFVQYYLKFGIHIEYSDEFRLQTAHINTHGWSPCVLDRFLIFKNPIFRQYSLVLYLDIDTAIYKDLDPHLQFFDQTIQTIGMVPEQNLAYQFEMPRILRVCQEKNLNLVPTNRHYYNAGVIFIKREILRDDIFDDLVNMIEYEFPSNDQDVLNIYFGALIYDVDPKFNLYKDTRIGSYLEDPNKVQTEVVIQHFAGVQDTTYKFSSMCQVFLNDCKYFYTAMREIDKLNE